MDINFQSAIDLTSILGEYVVHQLLDKGMNAIKSIRDETKYISPINKSDFEKALASELSKTIKWAHEVQLKEFNYSQNINSIYVELDLYFSLRRDHFPQIQIHKYKFSEILRKYSEHLIILGQPGAGKTTSLKHLCYSLLLKDKSEYHNFNIPILIKLKDLSTSFSSVSEKYDLCIFRYLFTKFGFSFAPNSSLEPDEKKELIIKCVSELLDELNVTLLLDGFDEISDYKIKEIINRELHEFAISFNRARFILTSRLGEFNLRFTNSLIFEICSLSELQIKEFAFKKFSDSAKADAFIEQISKSTYFDAAMRPLTLAYLTLIFERFGKIHEKPKEIYKRILRLLIEDWNIQNSTLRHSKYSNFDADRKLEFLAALAFYLTIEYGPIAYTDAMLESTYKLICNDFSLPVSQGKKVIEEIETHNGIFTQTYHDTYEFSHKSLQEYLTADFLVRQPLITDIAILEKIPAELAISVALSSSPTKLLCHIVFDLIDISRHLQKFLSIFTNRLFIERPDFKESAELIAVFLYMYKGVKGITSKEIKEQTFNRNYLFDYDNRPYLDVLEALLKSEICTNSLLIFKEHYQIQRELSYFEPNFKGSDEQVEICVLKRIKLIPGVEKRHQPLYLPLNSNLIKIFNLL